MANKLDFYSRPCGRGDVIRVLVNAVIEISTHAPAGGATYNDFVVLKANINFYSRPCGRGDDCRFCSCNAIVSISTHAPAGGATFSILAVVNSVTVISTHAPAGGATRVTLAPASLYPLFLLTPLREGRLGSPNIPTAGFEFLLTPLREGRPDWLLGLNED